MPTLDSNSPLPINLDYMGVRLSTVGDASAFISGLSKEHREEHHWQLAYMALTCATREPVYLNTAILTLRTALTLHELRQLSFLEVV